MEQEVDEHVNEAAYDQFLGALAGMVEAHPHLDYSFLPPDYVEIIHGWQSAPPAPVEGTEQEPALPVPVVEVVELAAPEVVGPSEPLERAAPTPTDLVEFVEERPAAEVTEDPTQATE